jgi:hypothetical protein
MGFSIDGCGEPFPDNRPACGLAEYIGHLHIPGDGRWIGQEIMSLISPRSYPALSTCSRAFGRIGRYSAVSARPAKASPGMAD